MTTILILSPFAIIAYAFGSTAITVRRDTGYWPWQDDRALEMFHGLMEGY